MVYNSLLRQLYAVNLHGGIKLGLDNMQRLCAAFGNPERTFSSIHVAGTNGKGSVATKIAKVHELAGIKVGLYTSPHISSFRERIQVDGKMISEKSIEQILPKIFSIIDETQIPATFFEITTLLAFLYFMEENVEVAVLETGLGGRLDATNVVSPKISVITSISIDHTDQLGSTLETITQEKAGIIKKGVPVVIGPRVERSWIAPYVHSKQCSLTQVNGNFNSFHEENCAVAKQVLELLGFETSLISLGLLALPPCRMEYLLMPKGRVILDVAHNPDGITHLFAALPMKKYHIVLGLSKNKDVDRCASIIQAHAASIEVVCAPNGRGMEVMQLKDKLIKAGVSSDQIKTHLSIKQGVKAALSSDNYPILIFGSFFIMAEARRSLGIEEIQDNIDLN